MLAERETPEEWKRWSGNRKALAENSEQQHGKNALVAGLAGVGGRDAVGLDEERDSRKQNGQDGDDDGKRALRVFHAGLAKGFNAVADGLDARQRSAAAGEHFEEQPVSDDGGDWRGRWQYGNGNGVAMAEHEAEESAENGDQQRADKKVSGNHENDSGFAQAAQIENSD